MLILILTLTLMLLRPRRQVADDGVADDGVAALAIV